MNFFIRFGVHKDREVIKDLRSSLAGIVVPAHILSYSPNPTIAAIDYINRPYYIDPMTYIYSGSDIADYVVLNKKTRRKQFKPSISKMTKDYDLAGHFEASDYAPLTPSDFSDEFVQKLVQKNVELQLQKIEQEKGGAYKRYKDLLSKVGAEHIVKKMSEAHRPAAVIPPYFYFATQDSPWREINRRLYEATKSVTDQLVVPIVLTDAACLTEDLFAMYPDCREMIVWIDNLNEKEPDSLSKTQIAKLKQLASFVTLARDRGIGVINLYGSYFSLLLSKLGMTGICNGVFYGEYKTRKSTIGGAPPSRYYIRAVHEFFSIPNAIGLLKDPRYSGMLDTSCKKCMDLIDGKPDNIIALDADHAKAQRHFVYAREQELDTVEKTDLAGLIEDLNTTYTKYNPLDPRIVKKSIDYLAAWARALE